MTRIDSHGDWCPREPEALAYASGGLGGEEVAAVEAHLCDCAICRESVAALTTLVLPDETPEEAAAAAKLADDSAGAVRALLDERLGPPKPGGKTGSVEPFRARVDPRPWVPWLAAAALVVLAVGGYALWKRATAPSKLLASGTAALDRVMRDGRPFEYRLSETEYVRYEAVRGGGPRERRDMLDAARATLAAAVAEDPTPEARRAYGRALAASGNCKEAIVELRKASEVRPNDTGTTVDLGVATACAGDPEGARTLFDAALAVDPRNAEALFNRGLAARRAGDTAAARADFERYLTLDPSSPWADEARRALEDMQSST